jgi:hypothetical protein
MYGIRTSVVGCLSKSSGLEEANGVRGPATWVGGVQPGLVAIRGAPGSGVLLFCSVNKPVTPSRRKPESIE